MSIILIVKYSCKPNNPVGWAGVIFACEVPTGRYNNDPSMYCNTIIRPIAEELAANAGCTHHTKGGEVIVLGGSITAHSTFNHKDVLHSANGEY